MNPNDTPSTTSLPPVPPQQEWVPVASVRAAATPGRTLQMGVALITLGLLAGCVILAFVALLDVVRIWFEYQWVPVARAGLAIVVAAVCVYVLRLIVKGRLLKAP